MSEQLGELSVCGPLRKFQQHFAPRTGDALRIGKVSMHDPPDTGVQKEDRAALKEAASHLQEAELNQPASRRTFRWPGAAREMVRTYLNSAPSELSGKDKHVAQIGLKALITSIGIDVHEEAVTTARLLAAQRGLAERAEFRSTDATGPLPFSDGTFDAISCIDAINHFSDRSRVLAEWTRLLKVGGRLLFTDPITLTGALTNAEIATRSSAGFYLFVPHGYDERVIEQCGLRLLVCQDVTANMAKVAEARRAARTSRSAALREIEGDQAYDSQQEFLAVAARVAREGRLSRFVYVAKKLN